MNGLLPVERFSHEALLYSDMDEYLAGTIGFIREGLAASEPILVVVGAPKIAALKARLGAEAGRVQFKDMAEVGANPARIIPAWHAFVGSHAGVGRPFRGIGEPIYPERSPAELVECQRHEALLNLAFDGGPAWRLLCPYNTTALSMDVIEEAHRSHPYVAHDHTYFASGLYVEVATAGAPFTAALPEPPSVRATLDFNGTGLRAVRRLVSTEAARAGFTSGPIADLVLAVGEVATNSVEHGGGSGTLRIWRDGDVLVCEIRDGGHFDDPLADRRRAASGQDGGRGLWLANQLCDLIQMRSLETGTTVRLHMHRNRARGLAPREAALQCDASV
jgi:anti-sigma regulatory factor (Ser/Thr protein kinase)